MKVSIIIKITCNSHLMYSHGIFTNPLNESFFCAQFNHIYVHWLEHKPNLMRLFRALNGITATPHADLNLYLNNILTSIADLLYFRSASFDWHLFNIIKNQSFNQHKLHQNQNRNRNQSQNQIKSIEMTDLIENMKFYFISILEFNVIKITNWLLCRMSSADIVKFLGKKHCK